MRGRAGEEVRVDINIVPPANNMFDITGVAAENGTNIRFQLEKSNAESRSFVLHVFNTRPEAGRYFDKITLSTTSGISPELTIRVFGIIRD